SSRIHWRADNSTRRTPSQGSREAVWRVSRSVLVTPESGGGLKLTGSHYAGACSAALAGPRQGVLTGPAVSPPSRRSMAAVCWLLRFLRRHFHCVNLFLRRIRNSPVFRLSMYR